MTNPPITHRKAHIDARLAWTYYEDIDAAAEWERPVYRFYGKPVSSPRGVWFLYDGPQPKRYVYSGVTLRSSDMNGVDAVLAVREAAAEVAEVDPKLLNSCLLNKYEDGKDNVAWHADDEDLWGPDPLIVSVSLGGSRDFRVRCKSDHRQVATYSLGHGDVVVMWPGMQRTHQHSIPKRKDVDGPRINLTFRSMV